MIYKPDDIQGVLHRQFHIDIAGCTEEDAALWATPQANTTSGELPEYLVNIHGNEVQPGEKMYRSDSGRMVQTALTTQVKMWPGEPLEFRHQPISKYWPRPSNAEIDNVMCYFNAAHCSVDSFDKNTRSITGKRAMLNPDWEEMLMGFPVGWTKLNL